ncbi:MAG: Hydrolase, alpha/beta fold family functionally coupled to Phosphoribulokinase [Labilithrix sp.]|nr:Hydrolase, alpha/beta fold family functionally coupled to Phosphoribulokinase [Labilithrix sp.]
MPLTDFRVSRWLRSPHLQTFGAAVPLFAPPASHAEVDTEELRLPLTGARDADAHHALHARGWWITDAQGGRLVRPVVVLVHGIGGSSRSRYVVRAAVALHRAGYHVVRLDLRGAGASTPDVPSLYHAGLSDDLALVTAHLAKQSHVDGVVLFGFSGGGSLALKLAGELGAAPPAGLRAVVSVSAPLDFTKVVAWMDGLRRLPYRFHVLRGLSNGARVFAEQHPERAHYRPQDVKRLSSFRYYDASIIVPMHGFDDVDGYYAAASPGPLLPRIAVPTLLLHAADDPMVPSSSVVPWLGAASPSVEVAVSHAGGHLGWVTGLDEASWIESWPARRALAFLRDKVPFTGDPK